MLDARTEPSSAQSKPSKALTSSTPNRPFRRMAFANVQGQVTLRRPECCDVQGDLERCRVTIRPLGLVKILNKRSARSRP